MGRLQRLVWTPRRVTAGVTAGLAYAVLVSFTRPFTWTADVAIAMALVLAAVVTIGVVRNPDRSAMKKRADEADRRHAMSPRWMLWMAPILAVTGWELYCFVSLPRVEHPTLSSLIDMLDATRPGKIVAVCSWLALGWFLVTR